MELTNLIKKGLDPSQKREEVKVEKEIEYVPISIDKFTHGSGIKYPIFIQLSSGKYIKISPEGKDVDKKTIQKLKKGKVENLYLMEADYEKYLRYVENSSLIGDEPSEEALEEKSMKFWSFLNPLKVR